MVNQPCSWTDSGPCKVLRVQREVGGLGECIRGDKTTVVKQEGPLTIVPPRVSQMSPIEPFREESSAGLVTFSGVQVEGGCVEQACSIFYILHRILYILPEVRGEGTCGGGREERSVNHIA